MDIKTRRVGDYISVEVQIDGLKIDLGLHDENECNQLAEKLIDAAYSVGPAFRYDCDPWFFSRLENCGITFS